MTYKNLMSAIDQYIWEILPHKSDWTYLGQKGQLRYWKSKLGEYRMNQITPEMIESNLPDRSPATKNRYLSALSGVFNNFYSEDNPVYRVKKYKEPRSRVRFLSDNERIRLLESCKRSTNPHIYSIVVLLLSSGMRKNEVLKLTWDRVDLDRGLIHLIETKNDTPRTIPIGGHTLELISNLPRTCKYVFPSKNGSYYRDIGYHWYKALRESNITDFRLHDTRHTAASYMAMQGVPLLTIGTILGHKSIATTTKYTHLSIDHLRGVLAGLDNQMFGGAP